MNHEDSLQTLNDLRRCCGTHDLNFIISAELVNTTNTESPDSKGPNKSRAKSCHGPCVKGVDLIGSGWAGLLTSWHPKYVLQKSFCRFVNPGPPYPYTCPSCASVRTHGLNLLGITILVPWGFSLPITRSSLVTDMYYLSWPSLQVLLCIHWCSSLNSFIFC